MSGETRGEVQVLRSLGQDLRGRTLAGHGPVASYAAAIRAFNAAPMSPELATHLTSRASGISALLDAIGVADDRLVAYAEALEWADSAVPGLAALSETARRDLLNRLTDHLLAGGDLDAGSDAFASLGRHVADRVRELLDDPDATIEDLAEIAELLAAIGEDEVAAAAFFNALGPEGTAQLPLAIEEAWQRSDGATDQWPPDTTAPWDVLLTISTTLAVASHTMGEADGLSPRFFSDLLAAPHTDDGSRWPPTHGEVALLFAAGGFSDDALTLVASHAAGLLPESMHVSGSPWSPWGVFSDPATTLLHAISESPMAAAHEPTVLAQLLALGQLSEEATDVAMLEAARRSAEDPGYATAFADELVAVGLMTDGHVPRFQEELQALGAAVAVAGAASDTIAALWERSSNAGRDLRTHPDAAVRSEASRTLRNTPPWLRDVIESRTFRVTGRALPAAGIGIDLLLHLDAGRSPLEAGVRTGTTAAGAAGGGALAAKAGAPLLAFGPWGAVGYGVVLLTGTTAGGAAGDGFGAMFFMEHPDAGLWFADLGREPLPAPGPPELVVWE